MTSHDSQTVEPMLVVDSISKAYRKNVPVNNAISLTVGAGEIFGLLGPNGAGKSTLVSQIVGLVKPDSGRITLDGVDVVANPGFARQACSFQAQTQVPIRGLTTQQAIELVGQVRGGSMSVVRERTKGLVDRLEMGEWAQKPSESFSGGMRRLVAFCMAAVAPGRLVILDEPTNDVDPLRRRLLWREVRALAAAGSAVLLVTHNVLEAERAVDRLAVMDAGRVIAQGTPAALKNGNGGSMRLEAIVEPGAELADLPGPMQGAFMAGRRMVARVESSAIGVAVEWARRARDAGRIDEFSIGPASLEDAYLRMVGRADAAESSRTEVANVEYAS